jgi:hypothetical protein
MRHPCWRNRDELAQRWHTVEVVSELCAFEQRMRNRSNMGSLFLS